jgi:taurine dioxygenase
MAGNPFTETNVQELDEMHIVPHDSILGATVTGVDLAQPLSGMDFGALVRALATHGVLRFPGMRLTARQLKDFSLRFGTLHSITTRYVSDPEVPEVDVLSNIVRDGNPIGLADGGQSWHTDMSYNRTVGYINALVAYEVPMRDGKPLGATEFINTAAAYDDLPAETKRRLEGKTSVHDFNQYWELRRKNGSARTPLTPQERAARPPSRHPVVMRHPVNGRKFLYVNPAYCDAIEGVPQEEGRQLLQQLFQHMLQPKYRYVHHWTRDDLLVWDHLWTWHNAVADYGPDEHRMIIRCQVTGDRVFDPAFVREALADTP